MHNITNLVPSLVRWKLRHREYQYHVIYNKGAANVNADVLSRNLSDQIETDFDVNYDDLARSP